MYFNSKDTTKADASRDIAAAQSGLQTLKDLPEYKEAVRLSKMVTRMVQDIQPGTLWYGWADQIYRSANSVAGNISEGVGRITDPQIMQFYRIARGSLLETITYLLAPPPTVTLPDDVVKVAHQVLADMDRTIVAVSTRRLGK